MSVVMVSFSDAAAIIGSDFLSFRLILLEYQEIWIEFFTDSGRNSGKMKKNRQIDRLDMVIIYELSRNGRLPVTELAARVGLSKSPCQARMKRLLEEGFITGFRAVIDPKKMDLEHVAFAEIKLSSTTEEALQAFNDAVRKVPEVESCHMIAGAFDYLLKVRTQNIRDYRRALGEVISTLPNVASTSTHVSMQAVKDEVI